MIENTIQIQTFSLNYIDNLVNVENWEGGIKIVHLHTWLKRRRLFSRTDVNFAILLWERKRRYKTKNVKTLSRTITIIIITSYSWFWWTSYFEWFSGLKITSACYWVHNVHIKRIQSGTATCSEGFVTCFLKVPFSCLGSMAAAIHPNPWGNSQKTLYKTFGTSCRPQAV